MRTIFGLDRRDQEVATLRLPAAGRRMFDALALKVRPQADDKVFMEHRSEGRPEAGGHGHLVEFYETESFLAATVADFVTDGLAADESAIIVATAPHREAFLAALHQRDIDVDAAIRASRLVLLDAGQTLATFMADPGPDPVRFREQIAAVLDGMTAGSCPRVYGEMVAVLWDEGNVASAIALEGLWNELAAERDFELMCAYPISAFDDPADAEAFRQVCEQHSRVIPTERYTSLPQDDDERGRVVADLEREVRALRHAHDDGARRSDVYRSLALEDPMTGLPNRRAFDDRLQQASESGEQMTLLLVDVDGLKQINERRGHDAGDALLSQVGQAIIDELRPGDAVGRIGGDEFGVLLSPRDDLDAAAIAERIRVAVQRRCSAHNATVSIGGASCDIDRSRTTLSADRALDESKRHGRNQITVSASDGPVSRSRQPGADPTG